MTHQHLQIGDIVIHDADLHFAGKGDDIYQTIISKEMSLAISEGRVSHWDGTFGIVFKIYSAHASVLWVGPTGTVISDKNKKQYLLRIV